MARTSKTVKLHIKQSYLYCKVKVKWMYIAPSHETSKALRHGLQVLPAITPMPAFTS